MSEKDIENKDSQNLDGEEQAVKEDQEGNEEVEKTDDISKLEEENKQLYIRLKKSEKKTKTLKEQLRGVIDPQEKEEVAEEKQSEAERIAKMEFRLDNSSYSKEDIDYIFRVAKAEGIEPAKAAEMPDVKGYIAYKKEKTTEENNTMSPSSRVGGANPDVDLSKIDLGKISQEEFTALQEKILRSRNNN